LKRVENVSKLLFQERKAYSNVTAAMLNRSATVPRWRFLVTFLRPVFSASRVQQVSDLHLKFASNLRRLRLGEEKMKKKRKNKRQYENIMVCPIPKGKRATIKKKEEEIARYLMDKKTKFRLFLPTAHHVDGRSRDFAQ